MNSRKRRQPLPAFHRHRDPVHAKQAGGPIVDIITMLDDIPAPKRAAHLKKLAQRYFSNEGVYSIVTPAGSSSATGPQHTYMSVALAMCKLASPTVLSQWNTIVLNGALKSSTPDNARPAMSLVYDALEAYRPDVALDMLEQVAAWHALQPRPNGGTGLLRTDHGQTCVGGLIAQAPDDAAQRHRLLAVINNHAKDPNGYLAGRLHDLMDVLADKDKRLYDSFVDTALQNAMSPEFAPHVSPVELMWAALNRCSPEALSHALQSPLAHEKLVENIDTVAAAINEFVFAVGVDAERNDDLGKFEQVIGILLEHAPATFPDQLRQEARKAGKSLPFVAHEPLLSLIDKAILNHAVTASKPGYSSSPRF